MSKSRKLDEQNFHRVGKDDRYDDVPSPDDYVPCIYCDDNSCGMCDYGMLMLENGKVPCIDCGGSGYLFGLEFTICETCRASGLVAY